MKWRALRACWLNQDEALHKIATLEIENGTLTVERDSAISDRESAILARDSARLTNQALLTANTALATSNVRLARSAEAEELLCEEASFWLMTLPVASRQHYHQIHDWLQRCDHLLHADDEGQPTG